MTTRALIHRMIIDDLDDDQLDLDWRAEDCAMTEIGDIRAWSEPVHLVHNLEGAGKTVTFIGAEKVT